MKKLIRNLNRRLPDYEILKSEFRRPFQPFFAKRSLLL